MTISSAMGFMSAPRIADYSASKAAAMAFHEGLQSEIKYLYKTPGVKTTLLCCAKIETGMFKGVKERFPFWTPALEPLEVVREIIESMEQRRGRNQVMLPFFVNFVPLVSVLPIWIGDMATRLCGADKTMNSFVGKLGKVAGEENQEERESIQVVDAIAEATTLDKSKKNI
ncbi:hypothetical protein BG004_001197 [Podila humilis]|nr:hypothetical protein BG004_001197 [Podila humilis]